MMPDLIYQMARDSLEGAVVLRLVCLIWATFFAS